MEINKKIINLYESIFKYKCKRGKHKVYIKAFGKTVWFCNACGEYITEDTGCSNPWCPEEMS